MATNLPSPSKKPTNTSFQFSNSSQCQCLLCECVQAKWALQQLKKNEAHPVTTALSKINYNKMTAANYWEKNNLFCRYKPSKRSLLIVHLMDGRCCLNLTADPRQRGVESKWTSGRRLEVWNWFETTQWGFSFLLSVLFLISLSFHRVDDFTPQKVESKNRLWSQMSLLIITHAHVGVSYCD